MVLAQKQKHRSMEQDREPQHKPTHLWSINLQQRKQEYTMEKKIVSSLSGAGKVGQPLVKNEIRTFSNIIFKNKLKMD